MTTSPVMSITDELVAELEALASKATPGPWNWDGRKVDEEGYVYIPECSYLVGAICLSDNYEGYQDDCDFMAAANPSVIRALLAERAELKQRNERMRAALNDARYRIEQGRIWNGMGWTLTGLSPHGQQKALDALAAADAEAQS